MNILDARINALVRRTFGKQAKTELQFDDLCLNLNSNTLSRQGLTFCLNPTQLIIMKSLLLSAPKDISGNTQGTALLIQTINTNYQQIEQLIKRERVFTRYASHELRTPLMVMKGATSLFDQSNVPDFLQRQKQRLNDAIEEMTDFIDALLSLTRDASDNKNTTKLYRSVMEAELDNILRANSHLLRFKKVTYNIQIDNLTTTYSPENILKVLIGNLIKNAFNCTEERQISLLMNQNGFSIIDSGIGLDSKPRGIEGFGLGLLIVRDICQLYDLSFTLNNKEENNGCIATVLYNKNNEIS